MVGFAVTFDIFFGQIVSLNEVHVFLFSFQNLCASVVIIFYEIPHHYILAHIVMKWVIFWLGSGQVVRQVVL